MTKETATFDLFSVLADQDRPTDTVTVYFNEALMRDIVTINKELTRLSVLAAVKNVEASAAAAEAYARLDEKFVAEKAKLRDQAYTVHLRGIPATKKSAIQSKALHAVPIKRDPFGNEDILNKLERTNILTKLIFAEFIEKIVAPNGAEQVFDEENQNGLAIALVDTAPEPATIAIDEAIEELSGKVDLKLFEEQDVDFLS